MKPVTLIGVGLIVLGIAGFVVGAVTTTDRKTMAQVGDLKITAETQQQHVIPPWLSGAVVLAGIAVAVYGFVNKR